MTDPKTDYIWSLAYPTSTYSQEWDIMNLIPFHQNVTLTRLVQEVTGVPPLNSPGEYSHGLAYLSFQDGFGSWIEGPHIVSCWSTVVYRTDGGIIIPSRPQPPVGVDTFPIASPILRAQMEWTQGGIALRINHPGWNQYCMPAWKTRDEIAPGGYHVQACLGMYQGNVAAQDVNNPNYLGTAQDKLNGVVSKVRIGDSGYPLSYIRWRLSLNLPTVNDTCEIQYSPDYAPDATPPNAGSWYQFFTTAGPVASGTVFYAGQDFAIPTLMKGVRVRMYGNGSAGLNKLFLWGPV